MAIPKIVAKSAPAALQRATNPLRRGTPMFYEEQPREFEHDICTVRQPTRQTVVNGKV
jgi:hypothetical protein